MMKQARTCSNRPVAGSHVAPRRGYSSAVILLRQATARQGDRHYRRLPLQLLFFLLVFSFAVQGFAATDLPFRYAFDRYVSLLRDACLFGPPTVLDCSRKIDPKDLYIESLVETPAGDVVRFRSATDPNFSMTFTFKPTKLPPPKIWQIPDTSF